MDTFTPPERFVFVKMVFDNGYIEEIEFPYGAYMDFLKAIQAERLLTYAELQAADEQEYMALVEEAERCAS